MPYQLVGQLFSQISLYSKSANPQTKPVDLECESAALLLPSTSTIAIYYYYSLVITTVLLLLFQADTQL